MIAATRVALALTVAAMIGWAFAWPFAVSMDGGDPRFRLGSVATLLLFFACVIVLVVARARSRGPGGN